MKTGQIKSYLRFLSKNKLFTSISVIGLGVGVASCLLISLYIHYETSFDHYHEKKDRIYRLTSQLDFNGQIDAAVTNLPSGPTLLQDYPEVESYVRFRRFGREAQIKVDQKMYPTSDVWIVDSTVFNVFSYPMIQGDPKQALVQPNSIVLTKSTADRLFENGAAYNQTLFINNTLYQVTGIIEDILPQSEMQINALVSLSSLPQPFMDAHNQDWFRIGFYTYLLFHQPVNKTEFEQKLVEFEKKYVQPWSAENQIVASLKYEITPLKELHFDNTKTYDQPKGNRTYLIIFASLAVFLLLIAVINYINLNLAQGGKRSKEVGVRKATGAQQKEIFTQFISESVILSFLALIFGLIVLVISLPYFNRIIQAQISIGSLWNIAFLIPMIVIFALITLAANSYPAMLLSRLNPIQVLKGNTTNGSKLSKLNQTLIFIQFLFSLFMITATIMVQDQMKFISEYGLGFEKDKILTLRIPADSTARIQLTPWLETINSNANVIASSQTRIPDGSGTGQLMFRVEQDEKMIEQTINYLFVDEEFLEVMGLDLMHGRNFDQNIATDQQQAFIVNQKAAEVFGWYTDALNKRVQWGLMPNGQATNDGKVIGVVNNFNFQTLHNDLAPLVLCFNPNGGNSMSIRYNTAELNGPIGELQTKWNELAPGFPMQYEVLSTSISDNYQTEKRMHDILKYFSYIAIILALVGLFALVSYTLQSRIKEIGIRKVLGASTWQLIWLISKNFWILLSTAFIVSTPVVWWFIQDWLNEFAFRTVITPIPFILSYILIAVLSGLTIGYHIWRVSRIDPVKALRYE